MQKIILECHLQMQMAVCPHAQVAAQLVPMGAILEALALGAGARSAEFWAGVLSFEGCGRIRISDARELA